jgi:23S rRNA pseudouridine2605 synthase
VSRRQSSRQRHAAPIATEKLHKVLADLGLGSRRELERWIEAGRIAVNGKPATIGARVSPADRIQVDGVEVRRQVARHERAGIRVLLMNKSEGVICSRNDPEGRPTCFEGLPRLSRGRWVSVGRLDINSSGVLLFTNDGTLAHRLMHPSTGIQREYAVRVDANIEPETIAALREGVLLDDGVLARFDDIRHGGGSGRNHWYHVTLLEGRNREVRRLFESQGIRVSRLKRVRYGPVGLPSAIKRGTWRELSGSDVAALYRLVGLPVPRVPVPRPSAAKQRPVKSVLVD